MKRSTTILASVAIVLGGAAAVQILDGGDAGAAVTGTAHSSSNQAAQDGAPQ
ncbi:hypothetical protein DFR70_105151 [Nocardia tenerifensis]|uniref:Uncharacterized protein n=1 Tax=Nocardia tenerifensis TaxID=228006 RepID=A0A318JZS8_9NOCA|nr:hypothetical protein [Nocardia tenerifensis]PXX63969.1 hypothetical protein DFR70_105151 [Nocardia tenerifensis]